MTLVLYAHPFSSYCQKVLIALYENAIPFTYRQLGPEDPSAFDEMRAHWPLGKMPVLVDDGVAVAESSIIIEHLDLTKPGKVRLLPPDSAAALHVRFLDRFFDLYVMAPMQKIVGEALKPSSRSDDVVSQARRDLDTAYAWLEDRLTEHSWAVGETFSLADCAAAPALFYADWVHGIGDPFPKVRAYRERLIARQSFRRAVEEARPYRAFFPLGAPDRD